MKRTEETSEFEVLRQQFKALQTDWESFKQSGSFKSRIAKTLELMDNSSPRNLMSSLQNRGPPPSPDSWEEVGGWRVRNNDLAAAEIVRERRAAIYSGRMKGRRLNLDDVGDIDDGRELPEIRSPEEEEEDRMGLMFSSSDSDSDDKFGNRYMGHGDCDSDEYRRRSSSSSSSPVSSRLEMERETACREERRAVILKRKWGIRSKFLAGIGVMVLVITVGISSIRSFAGEDEAVLVPT